MAWNRDDSSDIALLIPDLELMHKTKKALLRSELEPRHVEQLPCIIGFFCGLHAGGRNSPFVEFVGKVPPEEAPIKGPSSDPAPS